MILKENEYHARQYGTGRTCSGPSGYKTRPARAHGRAKGEQYHAAKNRAIWVLYANRSNFAGPTP